jgi:hypothetical protein
MDTQAEFGFKQLFSHVVGDMAKAVCERNGESQQQQFARSQAAVHTIMSFLPRDVIEAMLAGHCVMFHAVMTDSIHETLRGEIDTMRRGTRSNIVALNKVFCANLDRLERYQSRAAEGRRDMPVIQSGLAQPKTEIAARTPAPLPDAPAVTPDVPRRTAVETPAIPARPVTDHSPALAPAPNATQAAWDDHAHQASPEEIAACRANPEAMAALDAGDPVRFARAMGIDMPTEAYLTAAAAEGSVFNRQSPATRPPGAVASKTKA